MSIIHIGHHHEIHGPIPLCGQAMWDDLTDDPKRNECWECASIAGAYSPELQERFNVNADGSERDDDRPCPCGVSHTVAEHGYDPDKE